MKLPTDLRPEHVPSFLIDQQEDLPFTLAGFRTKTVHLVTGDYSVEGLEHCIAIERKSLSDYVSCCGGERERFERELKRMLAYETRAVVVEASWQQIENGGWRSKISPESVVGSSLGWIAAGIPIFFPGDRARADRYTARILFIAARRKYRELRSLLENAEAPAEVAG